MAVHKKEADIWLRTSLLGSTHHPGTVADTAEARGRAGTNLLGFCGISIDNVGRAHIAIDDREATARTLEDAGVRVEGSEQVLVIPIEDRPDSLGELTRKIAAAGLTLTVLYVATDNRMIVGANDIEKLKEVLGQ